LRSIYCELTKDFSIARTLQEREVDARVQEILSTKDPDLIVDLRYINHDTSTKYEVFRMYTIYFRIHCSTQETSWKYSGE